MIERDLSGCVALVTGVGRRAGIGAAVALELAEAGAKVLITYLKRYDDRQRWGRDEQMPEILLSELRRQAEAHAVEVDLSEPDGASAVFREAERHFGVVDILVNNACHWEGGGIERVDAAHLDRHYAINTRAAVLLCAEFVRQESKRRGGRIINVTSGQGHAPMPGELGYVVTKAALDALTLSLAAELEERGTTVNAVDPGPTDTGWLSEAQKDELTRASPSGALATPRDTARLVHWLASDEGATVSGQIIRVQP